jgi:quercetin dioxygenase-like cupin family protein
MHTGNISDYIVYDGIKKQQIYKEERFHVMLLCLEQDAFLKPHQSNTDAFLTVLEGVILFKKGETDYTLVKGDMFTFKAGERHSVKALEDASLLIVK